MAQKLNVANLKLHSPSFEGHKQIPSRHTGDGWTMQRLQP